MKLFLNAMSQGNLVKLSIVAVWEQEQPKTKKRCIKATGCLLSPDTSIIPGKAYASYLYSK